jgi:predicted ATPase
VAPGTPPHAGEDPSFHLNKLPVEVTPFIGRQAEIAALSQILQRTEARLVTLTGPGGTGKTRLAVEVARLHTHGFEDGIYFVSLAELSDPALVAPTIAATLRIRDTGGRTPLETLQGALWDKRLLLALDNFEHLLPAAPLIGDLVRACPSLQILVTSREILHLSMEREFPVAPLTLPDLDRVRAPQILSRYDAVALFVDRANAARPDFVLTEHDATSVAAICCRLDGLPLALELAAARIRLFTPEVLLKQLSHSLDLLTRGTRDRPVRQQTLRATMSWSYQLLSPDEQLLYALLSVFAGGWTLDAAEAVCRPVLGVDALDPMTSLVEKSLVRRQTSEGEPRFEMLETIREHASEKLEERGQTQESRRRHALYYLAFAEAIRPELDGPGQAEALNCLEQELANGQAAMHWALETGETELGLRMASAFEYVYMRGHVAEVAWLETFLAVAEGGDSLVALPLRMEALQLAAMYAQAHGNAPRARAFIEESLALMGALDDPREIAYRLHGAGQVSRALGDYTRAVALVEKALPLFRELNDKAGMALALTTLGDVARDQGDAKRLTELCEESLRLCRKIGNREYAAYALHNLGVAARMLGDLDRARRLLVESLQVYRETGLLWNRAEMLASLAAVTREQGDLDEAEILFVEGLRHYGTDTSDLAMVAMCLEGLAGVAAARGHSEHAVAQLGVAHALRGEIGASIWPVDRPAHERYLAKAREILGSEEFTRAWEMGHAMPVERAIADILNSNPVFVDV